MVNPERLQGWSDYISRHWPEHDLRACKFLLVLGSVSVGQIGTALAEPIPYAKLRGLKQPAVKGHAGKLHLIEIEDRMGLLMEGRYHCNEWALPELDYSAVILPAYLLRFFGGAGTDLILTNAAGAVNAKMKVGDIVPLSDILNGNLPYSPLAGGAHETLGWGEFHSGMDGVFSRERTKLLRELVEANTKVKKARKGIYMFQMGPEYESVAQAEAIKAAGIADLVGMSTVPEAMWGHAVGLQVSGLSLVTNIVQQAGEKLDHEHVRKQAAKAMPTLAAILNEYLGTIMRERED